MMLMVYAANISGWDERRNSQSSLFNNLLFVYFWIRFIYLPVANKDDNKLMEM